MTSIRNDGAKLVETDYWETDYARSGLLFLSWNAGAARLLIPPSQIWLVEEFRSGEYVIISRGPWIDNDGKQGIEIMVEDHTNTPFFWMLTLDFCDRIMPSTSSGTEIQFDVYTRDGKTLSKPGHYRVVPQLPYRRAWNEQDAKRGRTLDIAWTLPSEFPYTM